MKVRRIYIAGPEVFLPNAMEIGERKKEICARHGFEGAWPFDNEINAVGLSPVETGLAIATANERQIMSCSAVIANITPWRSPSADPGTSFEMGFIRGLMQSREGLLLAYRNDTRSFIDRVFSFYGCEPPDGDSHGRIFDPLGYAVENFGLGDNLMLDGAVATNGYHVVAVRTKPEERYTDLRGFEKCVEIAKAHFGL